MNAKVRKWGNSLAVRIPSSFAKETQLEAGSAVGLSLHDGRIVIDPRPRRKFTLDELLEAVTRRNLHGEVATGGAVGREAW